MSGATKRFRCLPPHGIGLRPLEPYAELGIMFSCSSTPLFEAIRDCAAVAVGWVEVSEIDRLNIYWAAMLARQHGACVGRWQAADCKSKAAADAAPNTPST
jgi:antirestriction protein ArdC